MREDLITDPNFQYDQTPPEVVAPQDFELPLATSFGTSFINAPNAAGGRTLLGLGTISTQNANAVAITGGTVTGITDLAVADGGTGASTAVNARASLGIPKFNFTAVVDPTVNDDNTQGYGVGSQWVNTGTPKAFVCLDATTGAANWTVYA